MSKNIDIEPLNNKEQRHGLWVWYWSNGKLMCQRFYHNGKEVGYEEHYHLFNKNVNIIKYNI